MALQQSSRRDFLKNAALITAGSSLGLRNDLSAKPVFKEGLHFPEDFLWGVSTSAYQIEGAPFEDGKGESIWDRFTHMPGNTPLTGDTACDHYHRYKEDVQLLKALHVTTYRFSVSWPRVFPEGKGKPNPKGIDFYKSLVDELVKNNIKPMVTLNHWDLPQKLQDKGGWANRETADHFASYADYMFEQLGDKVAYWITHNEPWVVAFPGYAYGSKAPGLKDLSTAILVTHNLLLAHGKAVQQFREKNLKGKIGITLDLQIAYPATDNELDKNAAEIVNRSHFNWFADPIHKGHYPEDIWKRYNDKGVVMPEIKSGDMNIINTGIDYQGINYYHTDFAKHKPGSWWPYDVDIVKPEEKALLMRPMYPNGLYDLLMRVHNNYAIPAMVTENGRNLTQDYVDHNGEVKDNERIEYIYKHIEACKKAMDEGLNLWGYCVWAFLDNFEWGKYSRLGLVHTNFKTLKRTIKNSGHWYARCIKSNNFVI